MASGTTEWRAAQRNLMASQAATQDTAGAIETVRALEAAGGLALGDLVLGSSAIARMTTDDQLVDTLASAGDAGRTVGRYLSASRAYAKNPRHGHFATLAKGDGVIARMARHRETLALVDSGKYERAMASLRATEPSLLKVIAAARIAQYYYQAPETIDAWDEIADDGGDWRNVARMESARWRYNRGDYAGAADRMVDLLTDYDLDAMPVTLDWTAKGSMQYSARGQVGWQLAWTSFRNTMLDQGDFGDVMSLLSSAMQLGEPDVDRVLGRAADLAGDDPAALAEIVARALSVGQVDRAAPLLDTALAIEATPELLRLATQVAERQGRVSDAADFLERALAAEGDAPVALSQLRADLQHLLALRGRIAMLSTGAARDAALDAAVTIADGWRDVDPDNAAIDRQIGELLLAGGRREEAWRQLSTAIERHPMEGDGWALVAEVMEKEGRVDEALEYWQQAIVIDQTNPTWRMRKAQALLAVGRDAEGAALLREIVDGRKWHDRWVNVIWQVQQMVAQLPAKTK
jgi:Tfp pilus assembly protein PilF